MATSSAQARSGQAPGTVRPRPQPRTLADAGYVLQRWDWSETSAIIDLFTREHGRVALVAKGAKRPYSQLRAVLLPFQCIQASWGTGRGQGAEVHALKSAEWAAAGLMLRGAPLLLGFYLNELLLRLLPRGDPHPLLFDAYAQTLPQLAGEGLAAEAALRAFELVLLREHGVLPALDTVTLTQQPLREGQRCTLRPEAGLCEAGADEPGWPAGVSLALQQALSLGAQGAPHQARALAALQQVCALALADLKPPLRQLLHYHLGHQPLHTRQLMLELQNQALPARS